MGLTAEDISRMNPKYQRQILEQVCENQRLRMEKKEGKYHAQKDERGEITFDSKKEARRYDELLLLEKAGAIRNLKLQKRYVLQESYKDPHTGETQKAISYVADFDYERRTAPDCCGEVHWLHVTEDVKSSATRTRVYLNKAKMFRERYGYGLTEV